jgi:hypothetical protein
MYKILVVTNGEFQEGEDVELFFESYNQAVNYAEKLVESHYIVEIYKTGQE